MSSPSWTNPQTIIFFGSAFLATIFIAILVAVKAITTPHPVIKRHDKEKFFRKSDKEQDESEAFPSIEDEPTVSLSVVVPAYEEEQRLPIMLDETVEYLESKTKKDTDFNYEIIVVSDGSKDGTVKVAQSYTNRLGSNKIRVLELIENRGKGGAVRLGMQSARGKYLLFADADGATQFSDYDKIEREMQALAPKWQTEAIVIGSRAHLEDEAIATRSIFRTFLMHGFHFLVWLFAVRRIRDTQCGFKLLTRSAARKCFAIMHIERWAFDVELLFIAQSHKIPIKEISVKWTEIDGSKVTPIWSWLQMARDLFLIWFRYAIGAWTLDRPKQS